MTNGQFPDMNLVKPDVRYFLLHNNGVFAARMQIQWTHEEDGNQSHGVFEPGGYHDILIGCERTIDLKDNTGIPDGAEVQLNVIVLAGYDNISPSIFKFNSKCGQMARYNISGSTTINSLSLSGCF